MVTSGLAAGRAELGTIEFFHGSLRALDVGAVVGAEVRTHDPLDPLLDASRALEHGQRGRAIWVAASIVEATAIAAIQHYPARVPPEAIFVYRVRLIPFHSGPVALRDALRALPEPGSVDAQARLIDEYWHPSGQWWVREVLTPSMRVLEQVPAASEREIYLTRWVRYNQDRERARGVAGLPES